jgi:hypothetical protein
MLHNGQAASMNEAILKVQTMPGAAVSALNGQWAQAKAVRSVPLTGTQTMPATMQAHDAWAAAMRAHPVATGSMNASETGGVATWLSPGRIRSDAEIRAGMDQFGNYPTLPMGVATTPIKTANGYFVPALATAGGGQMPATMPGRGLAQFVPLVSKAKQAVDVAVNVTVKPSPEFITEHTMDVQQRDLDEARGLYRG